MCARSEQYDCDPRKYCSQKHAVVPISIVRKKEMQERGQRRCPLKPEARNSCSRIRTSRASWGLMQSLPDQWEGGSTLMQSCLPHQPISTKCLGETFCQHAPQCQRKYRADVPGIHPFTASQPCHLVSHARSDIWYLITAMCRQPGTNHRIMQVRAGVCVRVVVVSLLPIYGRCYAVPIRKQTEAREPGSLGKPQAPHGRS